MKRKVFIGLVFVAMLALVCAPAALAQTTDEPAAHDKPAPHSGFFDWGVLATYAGATAATIAVTQVFKGVGFIDRIPTRLFAYIVALIILIAATAFTDGITPESAALCIVNALMVSLASNGAYDAVITKNN